jgi:selenide,water dikinase
LCGVFTTDVLAPIVDDPEKFGRIVFANCISDICAMGAKPFIALNIALFPSKAPTFELSRILQGSALAAKENGVIVGGGHTAKDEEVKFGMAVLGFADKKDIRMSNNAKPGDKLILTKGIGTGILFAAQKSGINCLEQAIDSMLQTNIKASEVLGEFGCECCSDVTGFGLAVTLLEILEESGLGAVLESQNIPLLPMVAEVSKNYACPVLGINLDMIGDKLRIPEHIEPNFINILGDAQTSGGLLAFVKSDIAEECAEKLRNCGYLAAVIGEVTDGECISLT